MPETLHLSASRSVELGLTEDRAWRVESGCVELFLVWESEAMGGRRHHFASLREGSWIFDVGFGFRDHGISVLAIGQAETKVSVHDPQAVGDLPEALAGWVRQVENGLLEVAPAAAAVAHSLAPGPVPALPGASIIRGGGEIVWWNTSARGAQFFGIKEVDVEFVPLSADGWVACPEGAPESSALDTREFVARVGWMDDLARAHDLFLRTIQAGVVLRGEREIAARERRSQVREAAGDAAWGEIASVLAGEQTAIGAVVGASSRKSLHFAFDCVARHRGIGLVAGDAGASAGNVEDAHGLLAALARKASVRMRRVLLEGAWFRRDNGALIGFLKDDGEAVALLPTGRGRYVIQRAAGAQIPVDARTREQLNPFAYCLYRSLPDRKLTAGDLLKFVAWRNGKDVRAILVMVVLTGLLGLVTPLLTRRIFDNVIPQAERLIMAQVGVALVTAAVVRVMIELARGIALLRVQNRVDSNLQAAVWDRLLKMPTRFFRKFTSGDLAMRAQGISEMHDVLTAAGATALFTLPVGLFNFIVMFKYSAKLALWGLALAVLALAVSTALNARQIFILRRRYDIQGKLAGLVFQLINAVAKFRIAGGEQLAFAAWAKEYAQQERLSVKAGRWAVASHTFFSGYTLLSSLVIFAVVAGMLGAGGEFSTGEFLAFNAAFGALVASLITMGESSLNLLTLIPLYERTKPIFEAEPEQAEGRAHPGTLAGGIEMAAVRFSYAADVPPVLKDFSLHVEPGEFVALVGPSGSGKSTILRLLLGFEKPDSGTVFYDRKDLQTLDAREVRRQVGVVLQGSNLIPGDIFRNIVGESNLTLDDAWRAAEMAGLAEDVRAMPMQMHTVISEGGAGFSGGQKQRLAIARALARNPRMIFFDEATSALDNRTQATVTASLDRLHATRLVIAHRLSTIIQADRIVVLRDGRVIEEGPYAELMKKKGFFYELASRQLLEETGGE